MNVVEKLFKDILDGIKEAVEPQPTKTTETDISMTKKKIEVELPEPPSAGGYASCPSGDTEYEEALADWKKVCNTKIVEAVPRGYDLKSSEVKTVKIVRHFAEIVVEKS